MYWICTLLTSSGQESVSTFFGQKKEIVQRLVDQNLLVVDIRPDYKKFFLNIFLRKKISFLSLAVFFEDFSNILQTGMSVAQALQILQESSKEEYLKEVLSKLEEQLN